MTSQLQAVALPNAVAAEQTYLQIPSQPEWIAPTVEYLKDKALLCGACHPTRAHKLMLALHEALTNSVIHGNLELSSELKEHANGTFAEALAERAADPRYANRPVEVGVVYDGNRCRWTITDQGKGFAVERVLARTTDAEADLLSASGRGILLMRAVLDDVRYELGGRRAILTLKRPGGEVENDIAALMEQRNPKQRPAEERRAHPRTDYNARITIEFGSDCPPVFGFARDLSRGGISFLTNTPLPLDKATLTLPQQEQQALRLPARIVRCNRLLAGIYDVGACFLNVD